MKLMILRVTHNIIPIDDNSRYKRTSLQFPPVALSHFCRMPPLSCYYKASNPEACLKVIYGYL